MPKVSEFFGIVILMYWKDNKRHHQAHFHARYGGEEAVFNFNGDILAGAMSRRASKLVKEWAKERKTELNFAWEQALNGKEIPWIAPIK
jgi:hypothetical protein